MISNIFYCKQMWQQCTCTGTNMRNVHFQLLKQKVPLPPFQTSIFANGICNIPSKGNCVNTLREEVKILKISAWRPIPTATLLSCQCCVPLFWFYWPDPEISSCKSSCLCLNICWGQGFDVIQKWPFLYKTQPLAT